MRIRTNTRLI